MRSLLWTYVLTVLLEKPIDDIVEVTIGFITKYSLMLQDISPKVLHGVFECFHGILHECGVGNKFVCPRSESTYNQF